MASTQFPGPPSIDILADHLDEEEGVLFVRELEEAGIAVVDEGVIYLPNCGTNFKPQWQFRRKTMVGVLKPALYPKYRYAGNFFFNSVASAESGLNNLA